MKTIFSIFFLCALAAAAQKIPVNPNQTVDGKRHGKWTIMVDKDWKEITNPATVAFYRIIDYNHGKPTGISRDYFLSGKVQWEGQLAGENPDINQGLCTWYDENGNKTKSITYKYGTMNGKATYFSHGKILSEGTYTDGKENLDWTFHGVDFASFYKTGEQASMLGDYKKAEENFLKAKDAAIKEFGAKSIQLKNTYWSLVYIYRDTDAPEKLQQALDNTIAMYVRLSESQKDDDSFIPLIEEVARQFSDRKDLSTAIKYYKVAASMRAKKGGRDYYLDLKFVLDYSYNLKQFDSMDYYFDKIASVIPTNERIYPDHLADWASFSISKNAYENFDRIEKRLEDYLKEKESKKQKDPLYARALITYGRLLATRGQTQRALKSYADARLVLEPDKELGKSMYLNLMGYGASVYNAGKKYDAIADEWFQQYEKVNDAWVAESAELYMEGMLALINYNFQKGNYTKAEALLRKSMAVTETHEGRGSPEYKMLSVFLASVLEKLGKTDESKAIVSTISKEDEGELIGKLGFEKAMKDIDELGRYLQNQEYLKAIAIFERSTDMVASVYIRNNNYSALVMTNVGVAYCYRETGNYARAQEVLVASNKIAMEKLGRKHATTVLALWNLGEFYQVTGAIAAAKRCFVECLKILDEMRTDANKRENDEEYFNILSRLARIYVSQGLYDDAEKAYYDVLRYKRERYGVESIDYASTYKSIADLYQSMRLYAIAEQIYREVEPVIRQTGENGPIYINWLGSMAINQQVRGKYELIEPMYMKVKDYYAKNLGTKSEQYAHVLSDMAVFYYHKPSWAQADAAFAELNQRAVYKIDNFFSSLSEQEKSIFYADVQKSFNKYNSFAIHYAGKSPRETQEIYDLQLTTKGLLFRSTNRVKETILSGKDDSLKAQYQRWISKKDFLAKVYQMSDDEKKTAGVDEKKMEESINLLEKEMTRRSEQFAAVLKTRPDWKQIQKTLKPGEAAVEMVRVMDAIPAYEFDYIGKGFNYDTLGLDGFVSITEIISDRCPAHRAGIQEGDLILEINGQTTKGKKKDALADLFDKELVKVKIKRGAKGTPFITQMKPDSVFKRIYANPAMYAALVLTPETTDHPELILLNNGDQMEKRYLNYYRNAIKSKLEDKVSYNVFFRPIHEKLKGVRTIYFSPDGLYNAINLNTLLNPETGKYLLDEVEIKLVGNTADLLQPLAASEATQVVLIGFPDYNRKAISGNAKTDLSSSLDFKTLKSDTSQRFMNGTNVTELPGTQVEVDNIEKILRSGKSNVNKWLAQQASEENIKALHSPKVLHIATHGFFMDNIPAAAGERGITGVSTAKLQENPLLRSGLLFAGAGKTIISGKENPQAEDGILTAYEAMNLDLQKTELVVLSACETGLGQVRAGEGVYGLQRAFRSAGARSVMMSLWKVDDNSTQELMTAFYQEWQSSNERQGSFRKAQQKLRDKYQHPYYWGAFVMVGN